MEWTEQQTKTRESMQVDTDRARLLNEVKKESLPVVQREVQSGERPFETINFQPVTGVGTFEAEFGVKGDDVIYHIWPYHYHASDRTEGRRLPMFKKDFEQVLSKVMADIFGQGRCELSYDEDIGAWFVKANGFASNQFHRDLCLNAARKLHKVLGGNE